MIFFPKLGWRKTESRKGDAIEERPDSQTQRLKQYQLDLAFPFFSGSCLLWGDPKQGPHGLSPDGEKS